MKRPKSRASIKNQKNSFLSVIFLGLILTSSDSVAHPPGPLAPELTQAPLSINGEGHHSHLENLRFRVADEIREAQKIIAKTDLLCETQTDCKELRNLYQGYQEALETLSRKKTSPELTISGSFKSGLLGAIQGASEILPFQATNRSLLELIEHIEENLPKTKQDKTAPSPFSISRPSDSSQHLITFRYHSALKRLLIQTRDRPIGMGSSKIFYEVYSYPNWQRLALGLPKKDTKITTMALKNEEKIFKVISQYPNARGLIETLHVDRDSILQKAHSSVYTKSFESYSRLTQLKLLEQACEGLRALHENEICHGDIKKENLLISIETQTPLEAVLTDFDLSYMPRELIMSRRKRPFQGTLPHLAPEVLFSYLTPESSGWHKNLMVPLDELLNVQVQTALKADVFSMATLVSEVLRPHEKQWYQDCPLGGSQSEKRDLLRCHQFQLPIYIDLLTSDHYHSLNYLLASALQPNPFNRINSTQFLNGIRYLRKKESISSPTQTPKFISSQKIYELSKTIAPEFRIDRIEDRFRLSQRGDYLLTWHTPSNREQKIRFSYLNQEGSFRSHLWDFDPTQPERIQEEVKFLKDLGMIQRDLNQH